MLIPCDPNVTCSCPHTSPDTHAAHVQRVHAAADQILAALDTPSHEVVAALAMLAALAEVRS